jgi:hypothetical protein
MSDETFDTNFSWYEWSFVDPEESADDGGSAPRSDPEVGLHVIQMQIAASFDGA